MAKRVGGILSLTLNGEVLKAKGEFTFRESGPKRNPVTNEDGSIDFTEEPMAGYIEGEITCDGSFQPRVIRDAKDASVVARLNNGQSVAAHEAFQTAEGVLNSREGNMGIRFESDKVEIL